MDPATLTDRGALEHALAAPRFLLLKHSPRCGISRHAFEELRAFVEAHPDVPHGVLLVRERRALSDRVVEATGVPHASPQAIWVRGGRAVWSASHFDVTRDALGEALAAFP